MVEKWKEKREKYWPISQKVAEDNKNSRPKSENENTSSIQNVDIPNSPTKAQTTQTNEGKKSGREYLPLDRKTKGVYRPAPIAHRTRFK